jgi:hypothetical protein
VTEFSLVFVLYVERLEEKMMNTVIENTDVLNTLISRINPSQEKLLELAKNLSALTSHIEKNLMNLVSVYEINACNAYEKALQNYEYIEASKHAAKSSVNYSEWAIYNESPSIRTLVHLVKIAKNILK